MTNQQHILKPCLTDIKKCLRERSLKVEIEKKNPGAEVAAEKDAKKNLSGTLKESFCRKVLQHSNYFEEKSDGMTKLFHPNVHLWSYILFLPLHTQLYIFLLHGTIAYPGNYFSTGIWFQTHSSQGG